MLILSKAHIILKECSNIRVFIIKVYIILENTTQCSFPSISFVTNQSERHFRAGKQVLTALSHIS